jgi:hypothetical protein
MVKEKKKIKIIHESDVNYTFLDAGIIDIKQESVDKDNGNPKSKIDKRLIKTRSFDSKKSKIRYNNRISGGHVQQSHSSVYE